jgi:chromosome partitioning protein
VYGAQLAERVRALGFTPSPELLARLRTRIVAVAAWKGGVGKTLLAYEMAWLLAAVLADFDWDRGGASRAWGYRHEARMTAPLLDALETRRVPRPLRGGEFRADLVPCHPDFATNQPPAELLATEIERWATEWNRPVVLDTHPGGVPSTYGALAAAHLVLVPAPLGTRELEALEGMVEELRDYPLLLIPNIIPGVPPEREIARLEDISKRYEVPVGPAISEYRWLRRRQRRMALVAGKPVSARAEPLVRELSEVGKAVINRVAD